MRRLFLKLFRRRRLERDLAEEMAFHREMAQAGGNLTPFGNPAVIAEQARDLWRFTIVENLWRDVVYGVRGLIRQPALVLSAVASLALGIGANATVFSLGMELLLSQPSVTDASSLVYVRDRGNSHSEPDKLATLRENGLFADVAGLGGEDGSTLNWNDGQDTRRVFSAAVTKNFFPTVGVPVFMGRGIQSDDPDEVVVLSHRFWLRRLARDPNVIGRAIILDGRPFTVVGVLPAGSRSLTGFGIAPEMYVPALSRDVLFAMYGRLEPGMSVRETRLAARAMGQRMDPSSPKDGLKFGTLDLSAIAGIQKLRDQPALQTVVLFFVAMLVVMGLVLLLACVNVAGLLLARGAARRRELAVRVALGAGRMRLLQQLLIESLLLACGGTVCGVLVARLAGAWISAVEPPLPVPIVLQFDMDWRVVTYATALAVLATLLSGVIPAFRAVRESIAPELHRERRLYLRRTLLVGQVAVSFVLLVTALIFVRNLVASASIDPGFDTERTIRATVSLSPTRFDRADRIRDYVDRGLMALRAVPGIEAAAASRSLPFQDRARLGHDITWADTGEKAQISYGYNAVTADYFRAIGTPIRAGREFVASDEAGPRAVVVNQAFVKRYLNGREAVGTTYVVGEGEQRVHQIVGVADYVRTITLGENEEPQLYALWSQTNSRRTSLNFVMRSTGPPAPSLKAVQAALRDVDAGVGLEVSTLRSSIGLAFLPSQVGAALMSAAGALALLLIATGLFGTMAFAVTRRTREIGLRLAVGATRSDVVRMVLRDSIRLMTLGLAVGATIAWFVTPPLAAFLVPGLTPTDPLTFGLAFLVMLATAVFATWIPARRAASVDPMTALRVD
jgi:predicted permease